MPDNDKNNANANAGQVNNLEGMLNATDLGLEQKTAEQIEAANKSANDAKALEDKANADKLTADKLAVDNKGTEDTSQSTDTAQAVEIDGQEYKLDDKGNALDKEGKVFKSKEELDSLTRQDDVPLIEQYSKVVGIVPQDENGKVKTYEDSEEGFIQYNKDVAEIKAKQEFEALINSDPDVKRFYEHKRRGGSTEDFINRVKNSWSRVKFDDSNEDLLKNVVIAELTSKGASKERAEQTANMYKDTNKLKEFAKESYTNLVNEEKAFEAKEVEQTKLQEINEEKETIAHWNKIKGMVDNGKVNNIVIPESDRKPFFDYMALAVDKNGNSQEYLDELTDDQLVQLKYLKFKKFDLSKLISAAVNQAKVDSIRKRFSTQKGLGEGLGIDKDEFKKSDDSNINLNSVMSGTSKVKQS